MNCHNKIIRERGGGGTISASEHGQMMMMMMAMVLVMMVNMKYKNRKIDLNEKSIMLLGMITD